MSAGNDPDLDAMFADVPANVPPPNASEPELFGDDAPVATSEEKAADAPAPPAEPERPRGPKKPWWDIYTSMLALTLLAIIFGCLFLMMEWSRYNFETTPPAISGPVGGG